MNIAYEPKKIIVSIDDVDYEVAQRTEEVDKKLREHNDKIDTMSSYEANYDLVKILLGNDAAKAIFPNGEKENLTRMYVIARGVDDAYNAEYQEIKDKELNETLSKMDEFAKRSRPVVEMIDKASTRRSKR